MSIKIMAEVWEHGPEDMGERFVLLALADYADAERKCWPAVPTLARKCCMSEKGIRGILTRLEGNGYLRRYHNAGKRRTNVYHILLLPRKQEKEDPERRSGGNEGLGERRSRTRNDVPPDPERRSPRPGTTFPKTRNEGAPNHKESIKEPSRTPRQRSLRFTEFWTSYPHPVGGVEPGKRKITREAYESALAQGATESGILAAMPDPRTGGKILEAAEWLASGQWAAMNEKGRKVA